MSETLQLGQHPDADQLSAFMEQALPPHAREATLAHLAVCAECRRVVAMALPPLEVPSDAAAAVSASPARARAWDWLRGWRLGWVAIPALAAVVVVGIYLRGGTGHREAAAGQVAELRTTVPAAIAPPTPRADARAEAAQATGSVPSPAARIRGRKATRSAAPYDLPLDGRALENVKRPAAAVVAESAASAPVTVMAASAQSFAAAAAPAPVAALAAGVPAKYAAMGQVAMGQVAKGQLATGQVAMDEVAAARAPGVLAPLPSGLPVLSMAGNLHLRVALDPKGALFASEDDGRHWTAVAAKWSGRAVKVAMAAPALPAAGASTFAFDAPRRISAGTFGANGRLAASGGVVSAGSLTGSVTDAAGAAIANAHITVTDGGGVTRTTTTDASGRYVVINLPPGGCRIRAESPGFEIRTVQADIFASRQTLASLVLRVGSAAQTVAVDASPTGGLEPTASPTLNAVGVTPEIASPVSSPVTPLVAAMSASQPVAKAMKARVVELPVFVLMTDTGERWTSIDGQSWTRE
jgi:hypothetical protein